MEDSKQTVSIMLKTLSFDAIMTRQSTFWPSTQDILSRHPSFEFLIPEQHNSKLRHSSPLAAIFNLVATVCGGGVLTLPIAFARVGILPSTVMMIMSAVMTEFSMYILCSCARRTGGKSYGEVTRICFGIKAEIIVTILLVIFLMFVIIAYMILVKDIWTPIIMHLSPPLKCWCLETWGVDPDQSGLPSDVFLIVFILCSLPLLLQRNLHSLRHTCYVGFASLILLIVAIVRGSYQLNFVTDVGIFNSKVKWYSEDLIYDAIYAFPIIALSFFSIYNVLSVHSALINPTRERVKFVLDGTIVLCLVLFYAVGLFGYLYAYDETKDNILLNFPLSDNMFLIGRLGYGFTLMFGLPLVFLPCRDASLSIPVLVQKWIQGGDTISTKLQSKSMETAISSKPPRMSGITKEGHVVINGIDFDEERPLLKRNSSIIPMPTAVTMGNVIPMRQLQLRNPDDQHSGKYGSTNSNKNINTLTIIDDNIVRDNVLEHNVKKSKVQPIYTKMESNVSGISLSDSSIGDDISLDDDRSTCQKDTVDSPSCVKRDSMGSDVSLSDNDDSDISIDDGKKSEKSEKKLSNIDHVSSCKACQDEDAEGKANSSSAVHFLSTISVLTFCYICAVAIPGVGLVWSICGSSMSLIIGFFVPAACYLKVRSTKKMNLRSFCTWSMLILSIFASFVCTSQIINDTSHSNA